MNALTEQQQERRNEMNFLLEFQANWLLALIQMVARMFILFALAVLVWWLSIVITDLFKRLKTGIK
jgi:hypothetical protein